ncbi:protein kinase domain containing protein [Stylonychia lemnae]|uniref:non-specific serine/threonine protein kinase n=1 Tax=Stylonychia lemnae TaxID=5949 RepID=A0A078B3L7_STYLE|nr:protein kinase domain containing protein [Stylonychia lemnae]|eukprot:CDW88098.1 protein kinase domain containing protein [Stylonychia lemnae]
MGSVQCGSCPNPFNCKKDANGDYSSQIDFQNIPESVKFSSSTNINRMNAAHKRQMSSQNQMKLGNPIQGHKKDSELIQSDDANNNQGLSNQKKKEFVMYMGDKKENFGSNGKVLERNSIQNVEIKIIPFNTPDQKKTSKIILANEPLQIERINTNGPMNQIRQINSADYGDDKVEFQNQEHQNLGRKTINPVELRDRKQEMRLQFKQQTLHKHKDSEQLLQVIRKMFIVGDESRINPSDVYENSNPGVGCGDLTIGRSQSILADTVLDRNRFLIDNFEVLEFLSVGSLSHSIKLRGKTSGALYLLKVIRKLKYGKQQKKAHAYFLKYKAVVSQFFVFTKPGVGISNFNFLASQQAQTCSKFSQMIKFTNFGNLLNFRPDRFHKRQYYFAEYLSPEQIEMTPDQSMMQAGELWNIGVILYVLYQGEYPFNGFSDEDVITEIIYKPNIWKPQWKDGIGQHAKDFILLLLDSNPYKKDKGVILNDPYILQHQTPSEIVSSNRVLSKNIQAIYEIHAKEFFIEAVITYLGVKNFFKKYQSKVMENLHQYDQKRSTLVNLDLLNKAFMSYYSDEHSYKLQFQEILDCYLQNQKCQYYPYMEVDVNIFFETVQQLQQKRIDKKLLKAVILMTQLQSQIEIKYERIEQEIQIEVAKYQEGNKYPQYYIDRQSLKMFIFKIFTLEDSKWEALISQEDSSDISKFDFLQIRELLDKIFADQF